MKKKVLFFGKLFIVTLLLFVFCFGVVMPQYTGNYQASMVDKGCPPRGQWKVRDRSDRQFQSGVWHG